MQNCSRIILNERKSTPEFREQSGSSNLFAEKTESIAASRISKFPWKVCCHMEEYAFIWCTFIWYCTINFLVQKSRSFSIKQRTVKKMLWFSFYINTTTKEVSKYFASCAQTYALKDDLNQVLILLLIWFLLGYDIRKFCGEKVL